MEQKDKLKEELEKVHERRKSNKRLGHFSQRRSKLAKYHAEIIKLRELGGSLEDIRLWLRSKRVKAGRSTIHRYLKQQEE